MNKKVSSVFSEEMKFCNSLTSLSISFSSHEKTNKELLIFLKKYEKNFLKNDVLFVQLEIKSVDLNFSSCIVIFAEILWLCNFHFGTTWKFPNPTRYSKTFSAFECDELVLYNARDLCAVGYTDEEIPSDQKLILLPFEKRFFSFFFIRLEPFF